jgi:hypothetical protein
VGKIHALLNRIGLGVKLPLKVAMQAHVKARIEVDHEQRKQNEEAQAIPERQSHGDRKAEPRQARKKRTWIHGSVNKKTPENDMLCVRGDVPAGVRTPNARPSVYAVGCTG